MTMSTKIQDIDNQLGVLRKQVRALEEKRQQVMIEEGHLCLGTHLRHVISDGSFYEYDEENFKIIMVEQENPENKYKPIRRLGLLNTDMWWLEDDMIFDSFDAIRDFMKSSAETKWCVIE